ncbi:phosphodiesterase [Allorhizobium sp. BGMRC 0089]|uniref:phosphodiesterase n=1 Tax=Allorhizobium sonneratiae TaxID=2934936 RepID=UPI00203351D3|nr:phosphodiesterase [Allorhizobium sonneratiae]MCM2293090.1 phosphodiesterase [Allorhizobium sonneratiae]
MTSILQLSDTHIVEEGSLAYGVVDTAAALEKAVITINAALERIGPVDVVIVSGDLTDFGSPQEYRRFRAITSALTMPILAVPGNHDRREAMRAAFADEDFMPQDGPINWHRTFEHLHVIGLDTLVEGEPYGLLTDETLAWLEKVLNGLDDRPVLIALHHPPFITRIGHMDRQNLKNGDALFAVLAQAKGEVRLACGHVHRMIATVQAGHAVFIAPSPSHAVALDHRPDGRPDLMLEPGGMLLHHYQPTAEYSAIVTEQLPVGDYPGPYPFFPD